MGSSTLCHSQPNHGVRFLSAYAQRTLLACTRHPPCNDQPRARRNSTVLRTAERWRLYVRLLYMPFTQSVSSPRNRRRVQSVSSRRGRPSITFRASDRYRVAQKRFSSRRRRCIYYHTHATHVAPPHGIYRAPQRARRRHSLLTQVLL